MALAEFKAGIAAHTCILLSKASKQMEYTMLTMYSPSDITNRHISTNSPQGTGQGPTDAPPR
eukprot:8132870-Ditylum_brightwellii.AAC.1